MNELIRILVYVDVISATFFFFASYQQPLGRKMLLFTGSMFTINGIAIIVIIT